MERRGQNTYECIGGKGGSGAGVLTATGQPCAGKEAAGGHVQRTDTRADTRDEQDAVHGRCAQFLRGIPIPEAIQGVPSHSPVRVS